MAGAFVTNNGERRWNVVRLGLQVCRFEMVARTSTSDGERVLTIDVDGLGVGSRIDVLMDESGNLTVTIKDGARKTLTINAVHYPTGIQIYGTRDDQDQVVVGVTDDSGTARNVFLEAIGVANDIVVNMTYDSSEPKAGQVVPGFDSAVTAGVITADPNKPMASMVVLSAMAIWSGEVCSS